MTPEQEHFWEVLRGDPAAYAHRLGKELRGRIDSKERITSAELHRIVDCELSKILRLYDPESVLQIMTTLVAGYSLPLSPVKLETFDEVSKMCHDTIYAGFKPEIYADPTESSK